MSNKKINVGNKVHCTHAATKWYTVGKIYDVVAHPENGHPAVLASDGHYDLLSMAISQFTRMDPNQPVIDKVPT